jgi:hypothetical protein
MDHFNLSASGNGDRFLNSSVNFPAEMRYTIILLLNTKRNANF